MVVVVGDLDGGVCIVVVDPNECDAGERESVRFVAIALIAQR